MTNNIDQLKAEVDNITNSLRELKNNVTLPEREKKKQAEALKAQADTTKQKIENEIKALKDATDSESIKNKNEAETLLRSLTEITDLYNSIVKSSPSTNQNTTQETSDDRNVFVKAKDWIGEQRDAVRDKDKWGRSSEGGKNLLRTAGFVATGVGAVALTYKGLKKLWNWAFSSDDEEDEETETKPKKKKKEKKPFWDRWYGKVIKYSVIGTGIYYVIHGIKTGKWDLSHFFDRNNNGPISPAEENLDDYTDFSHENPEKYREYEQIGENINLMYDKIRDTEKNYFGADSQIVMGAIGDKAKEQKIKKSEKYENIETRGLVPYSLDNFYNNVGNMLSYGGFNRYIRSKNIEEYQQKIKSFGAEWFDKAMVPFLSGFANFATFGILSTDTAQQKMDKYFKGISDRAGENLEILDLFFRQYTKVLTYMADKKNALASKIAREILSTQGYNGETRPSNTEDQEEMINEAINDSEWVDKNLKNTKYGEFLSSSIVGACRILKEQGLDNTEMTAELSDIVKGVDEQTAELLGGFDDNAFEKAEAKLNGGGSLDTSEKEALKEVADKTIEDLKSSKNGGWLYNTFDYCFELLGLSEADKQTILNESGISKALDETASAIQAIKMEISTNPTKENVEKLKKLVGEYTSMKKEIAVALYAVQEAKENKDLGDYVSQVIGAVVTGFGHFIGSINDLIHGRADAGDIINIFIGMTISGGMLELGGRMTGKKWAIKIGHYTKKAGLAPATLVEMGLGRTRWSRAVKHRINDLAKTNPTKAENLMKKKILDGVLKKKHVSSILQNNEGMKAAFNITGFQNNNRVFKEVVYNIFGEANKAEADLFIKYYGKANGLVSYSKELIGNGGLTDGKFTIQIDKDGFRTLKDFDVEFDKLGNTVQKSYFEDMLKKVKDTDDMELLNELIHDDEFKNIIKTNNVEKLKKIRIKQLRALKENGLLEKLKKGQMTIDEALDELKRTGKSAGEIIENLSDARKAFNKSIDKAIKSLEEWGNKDLADIHINKLKSLKNDMSLADDEMEGFVKFIDEGFDAKLIPDLKKLFSISDEVGDLGKVGERLKQLFDEGKYSEFKALLKNEDLGKIFKRSNIAVDDIVKNFDGIFKKFGGIAVDTLTPLIKSFAKILSKVL